MLWVERYGAWRGVHHEQRVYFCRGDTEKTSTKKGVLFRKATGKVVARVAIGV
jgi:hypothetical protein